MVDRFVSTFDGFVSGRPKRLHHWSALEQFDACSLSEIPTRAYLSQTFQLLSQTCQDPTNKGFHFLLSVMFRFYVAITDNRLIRPIMSNNKVHEQAYTTTLGVTGRLIRRPVNLAVTTSLLSMGLALSTANAADIIVTSRLDDNGLGCTLREAVESANQTVELNNGCATGSESGPDRIVFDSSIFGADGRITLSQGELLTVDKNLLISAASITNGITLVAGQASRVLNVDGGNIVLSGMAVTGGALADRGSTGERGGGIQIGGQASVELIDSEVTSNKAASSGGGIHVANGSRLSLQNTTIANNRVQQRSTVRGGGISVGDDAELTIDHSRIVENTVYSEGGSGSFAAGLLAGQRSTVSISNTAVSNNYGGAIDIGPGTELTVSDSQINNNRQGRGIGIDGPGAIDATGSPNITITRTSISNNSALGVTGGLNLVRSVATITDSIISGNESFSIRGGGFQLDQSTVSFKNSTISGNLLKGNRGYGGAGVAILSDLSFENVTLSDNVLDTSDTSGAPGLFLAVSSLSLVNSILANSQDLGPNSFNGDNCYAPTGATGNGSEISIDNATIIEGGGCNALRTEDPALLPLADNGGPTLTHALNPNSPAINSGDTATCLASDQRGAERDAQCDVGAFEFGAVTASLSVTIDPTSISEDGGIAMATVALSQTLDEAITIDLSNSDLDSVTLPTSVIIPAGAPSAQFAINAVDDFIVDGDANVTITASTDGFDSGSASLLVIDDDVPTVRLEAERTEFSENGGSVEVTLSFNTPESEAVEVLIQGTESMRVSPSGPQTLGGGVSSVTFEVIGVDDNFANGDLAFSLTPVLEGYLSQGVDLVVTDDEQLTINLSFDSTRLNEAGSLVGVITRNTPLILSETVTLVSSDPNIVSAPPTIEIARGEASAEVFIQGIDNLTIDPDQPVTITASFANNAQVRASAVLNFIDNDDDDNDMVANTVDNCPNTINRDQANLDGDAFGDACDSDIDGDGLPNRYELANGLNPRDADDANADNDGDGFTNRQEFEFGSDPNVADVDENNNGIPDAAEAAKFNVVPILLLLLDDEER